MLVGVSVVTAVRVAQGLERRRRRRAAAAVPTTTIAAAPEGQWVRIEVDDNGPGIPESERENVFRPFYRLDHARNQDEGNSGLGLAIARDIAKSHGGEIALGQSSMGGLRAIISLPQ